MKWLSDNEYMEIFKTYDKSFYDYLLNNSAALGTTQKLYAEYLINKAKKFNGEVKMTERIGSYDIDDFGETWDNGTRYRMVIFSHFDKNKKDFESKRLYFRCEVPDFKTEEQITKFLEDKRNCQRIHTITVFYK